ncbi:MAG: RNA polymerase sigma factor [Rudaea sp.]
MNRFQTTRWSIVLDARKEPAQARRALESLCRTYRPPVYAYICGHHFAAESAEDLTQAFFTRFIEQGLCLKADPQRGRFRTLLITALKRFLDDTQDREKTVKRGGRVQLRSLDSFTDSGSFDPGYVDRDTPEYAFHRAWAHTVVQAALRKLRIEAKAAGKADLFDELCVFIAERPDETDYVRVAAKFGLRRNTLAVAVHRLRKRLRELIREQLAETAANNDELDLELRELGKSLEPVAG